MAESITVEAGVRNPPQAPSTAGFLPSTAGFALGDNVIARFCPVLHLHHEDRYMPVPADWFIAHAALRYHSQGVDAAGAVVQELLPYGAVTQELLLDVQGKVPIADHLSLTVEDKHHAGWDCARLADVPIYAHAKLVVDDCGIPEAWEISYITFYAFNGFYQIPMGLPLWRCGGHEGDWEHLTVRLDAASLALQGVWYNAHRNIEGEWVPADKVPRTPDGCIVGYVAINGHGVYPRVGTILRLYGCANDRTSSTGPVWRPKRVLRMTGTRYGDVYPVVATRGCSLGASAHLPSPPPALLGMTRGNDVRPPSQPDPARGSTRTAASGPGPKPSADGKGTAAVAAAAAHATGAPASADGWPGPGAADLPKVLHDDSLWQRYEGRWGTVVSPALQCWFNRPEPPVSRGMLRRVFVPWAKGVEKLPQAKARSGSNCGDGTWFGICIGGGVRGS